MDLETMQIPLIFVAFFIVASVILSLVYKFGMKEKSYEEALAEQRQSTQSLLGIKLKPKEKKSKKISKKTKEKDPDDKNNLNEKPEVKSILKPEKPNNEVNQKQKQQETKPKIKFNKIVQKTTEEIDASIEAAPVVKETVKDKPVIVKKTEQNKLPIKEKTTVPKKDEQPKKETVKEKTTKKDEQNKKENVRDKYVTKKEEPAKEKVLKTEDQQPPKKDIGKGKLELEKQEEQPLIKEMQTEEQPKESPQEKVHKQIKSDIFIPNRERREVEDKVPVVVKASLTNGYIVNPPKDKKKKKNELNALQQLTAAPGGPGMAFVMNMVNKAELSHADIQMLINLLLNKQMDAPPVLDDWSEGKSDPIQKLKKQLAEKEKTLADEQETLAGVQVKLREIRNEQHAERSALNQKIKALEDQLQNQQMEIHACNNRNHAQAQQLQQAQVQLNEERMKLHSLGEELGAVQMQRQQLEMHIAQETEVRNAQLRADILELSRQNEQLLIDIHNLQKVFDEREASHIAQLNNITQELGEKARQIEALHMEIANKNEMLYRQEDELKAEIAQLNALMQQQAEEIRKTEQGKEELIEEINNLKKQKNISNKVITQLKSEIEKLQQDKSQNEASIENNKVNETEILNLKNELASFKNQLEEKEKKFKKEIETKVNLMSKLEDELEEQKTKNNELRNKNYKIMEALNAAESRIKNGQIENSDNKNDKTTEVESQKEFLSRLLPEINGLDGISAEKWDEECTKLISNYLDSLKKPKPDGGDSTENLQARVEHYQNVIKDTEGMLSKLQAHIDQEQISWKAQIKSKDLELEALKEKLEKSQNLESINGSSVEGH